MGDRLLIPPNGSAVAEIIRSITAQIAGPLDAGAPLPRVVEPMSGLAALPSGRVVVPDVLYLEQIDAKRFPGEVAKQLTAKGRRVRTWVSGRSPAAEITTTAGRPSCRR